MSYAQFQEHWEKAADAEMAEYRKRPAHDLLAEIARGDYGSYDQIWYALQGRTSIDEAGTLILSVLRSQTDYLVRYHCATLLLSLSRSLPLRHPPTLALQSVSRCPHSCKVERA
jgi:hypothetical protein